MIKLKTLRWGHRLSGPHAITRVLVRDAEGSESVRQVEDAPLCALKKEDGAAGEE